MGDAWWGGPWPTTCAPGRGGPGGTSPPGIPQRRKGVGTPLGGRLQSPFDQRQRAAMARRQEAEVKTRAPRGRNPPLGVSPGADPRLRTPGTTSPPGLPQRAVAAPALGCGGGCGCSARRSPGAQSRGEAPRRLARRQALTLGSALGTTSSPGATAARASAVSRALRGRPRARRTFAGRGRGGGAGWEAQGKRLTRPHSPAATTVAARGQRPPARRSRRESCGGGPATGGATDAGVRRYSRMSGIGPRPSTAAAASIPPKGRSAVWRRS